LGATFEGIELFRRKSVKETPCSWNLRDLKVIDMAMVGGLVEERSLPVK